MEVDTVGSVSDIANTANAVSEKSDEIGRDAFLKLLIAQLENQDPLDPSDATEFVSQLSELTSVERLIGIDDKLSGLSSINTAQSNLQVASMVGKTATVDSSEIGLDDFGGRDLSFDLQSDAKHVEISVRDGNGTVVRKFSEENMTPGLHTVHWDGQSDSGSRAVSGSYRISISAKSDDDKVVSAVTQVKGKVSSVSFEGEEAAIVVGGQPFRFGRVLSVEE